jgi:tRNA dimethylallyltransferase
VIIYIWVRYKEVKVDNVIVIVGPTASGKTKLSIELAKTINGEIISADSMQIYKHMDIGTAKPMREEMQGINHYLIDEVTPDEEFSVAKYQSLALNYIDKVIKKNKLPIIVGGTGLYINSLIYNIQFTEIDTNWELRKELQSLAEKRGNEFLHDELKKIDVKASGFSFISSMGKKYVIITFGTNITYIGIFSFYTCI